MPFIRTFVPIVAGAVDMKWRRFMFFNLFGGLLWAIGVTLAGYSLCRLIPPGVLDKYFLVIIAVVVIVSMMPALIHLWKEERHEIFAFVKTRVLRRPPDGKSASAAKKDEPGA